MMNNAVAVLDRETNEADYAKLRVEAKKAAARFTKKLRADGYKPSGFYEYQSEDGTPAYWRIRLNHPARGKWIRPLSCDGKSWQLKEPHFEPGGKPLYKLPEIISNPKATVYVTEGENCADALSKLGIPATTSGSSSSAAGADWSPLKNRRVVIWPDFDKAGFKYANTVREILNAL